MRVAAPPPDGAAMEGMTQTHTAPGRAGEALAAVTVGAGPLSFEDVVAVARFDAPVALADAALVRIAESRRIVEGLASDPVPHYGVSTGFGALATAHIPTEQRAQLQRSLIRSHAAGSGPEVEREVVRALMLLRLSTLATGRTGVREEIVRVYAAMLNAGITPVVHEYGSLGCSGDLAPLAHCALAAMGEGPVRVRDGSLVPAASALERHGITPVVLAEKEGLALINGTDGMLGMLVLAITDLHRLVTTADVTAAMSVEGLLGTDDVFASDLHALRPHPGQAASAANLRILLRGSEIRESHRTEECTRVQDAYSLRCAPQVAGGARDTLDHATRVAGCELAAAIDNPVVTLDGRVESNGNFHGAPVAYVLDFLAIVAADLASICGTANRPVPRPVAQQRPAAVPRRQPRRRLGPHDRPVHPGGPRLGDEAPRGSGQRRLDPEQRHAGGPRVDGLVRGAQAAPDRRRADPGPRRRADHRGPWDRAPGAAAAGPGHRGGRRGTPDVGSRAGTRPVPRSRDRGGRGVRRRRRRRPRRRNRHRPPRLTHRHTHPTRFQTSVVLPGPAG